MQSINKRRESTPHLSVIVPVRNGSLELRECIGNLLESPYLNVEIIVVDDASTDDTAQIAASFPVRLIRLQENIGPAAARNLGAEEASGEYLFFIDADICAHPDTVEKVVNTFLSDPDVDAVFGSYDREPRVHNVVSQYKNLFHHYVHQQGNEEASTFWSGCGAIKRSVFLEMGGFDASYDRPCIEDIELGFRLYQAGKRIKLNKSIQVTHLKRWTLFGMFKTDFWDRGVPWTELMLRSGNMPNDLNLRSTQRLCALMAMAMLVLFLVGIWFSHALIFLPLTGVIGLEVLDRWTLTRRTPDFVRLSAICVAVAITVLLIARFQVWAIMAMILLMAIIFMNYKFYAFFAREKQPLFVALVIPLHVFYYLYSLVSFTTGIVLHVGKLVASRVKLFFSHTAASSPHLF